VSVPDAFAGAGVFDLTGRVVGFVARCNGRLVALPVGEVGVLMVGRDSLGALLWARLGVEARLVHATERSYFGGDSGLLLTAVRDDSPADQARMTPGDIVVEINGAAVDSGLPPLAFASLATADSQVIVVRRTAARGTTRLSIPTPGSGSAVAQSGVGIELTRTVRPEGVEIDRVQPGSLAARAGLRPGDRLLRIGRASVTSTPVALRVLDRLDVTDSAAFIVFRRDSVSRGVLLRR